MTKTSKILKTYREVEEMLELLVDDLQLYKVTESREISKEAIMAGMNMDREKLVYLILSDEQELGTETEYQLATLRLLINFLNHTELKN